MPTYDETLAITCELIRQHVGESRPILPSDHIQRDLGLDSIGVMELVSNLEIRLDVNVPHETFETIATVEDVARAVAVLQK